MLYEEHQSEAEPARVVSNIDETLTSYEQSTVNLAEVSAYETGGEQQSEAEPTRENGEGVDSNVDETLTSYEQSTVSLAEVSAYVTG